MSDSEDEGDEVDYTLKFGRIYNNSVSFDDYKFIKKDPLSYRVSKVNIWINKKNGNDVISDIQFFYKRLNNKKELTPHEHKATDGTEKLEVINLPFGETLIDFDISFENEITSIGFRTNKGRTFLCGKKRGNQNNNNFKGENRFLIAPHGCYDANLGSLQSCGFYYIERFDFIKKFLFGYFILKHLLKKDPDLKNEIEKMKLTNINIFILRTCSLPTNPFSFIMKFCIY